MSDVISVPVCFVANEVHNSSSNQANRQCVEQVHRIDVEEFNKIGPVRKEGKLTLTKSWKEYLLKVWATKCNCVIAFGYSRVSPLTSRKGKTPFIRQDAHCTFENCCRFRVLIAKHQRDESSIAMHFITFGIENHGRQPSRFRRTTPSEAQRLESMLSHNRPEEVFEELIDKADSGKLRAGNFNDVKSPGVLRRLQAVVATRERFHKDVCVELDAMQILFRETDIDNSVKGFIQRRGSDPFYAIMYSEPQLQLLNRKGVILYLDATGSIFRKWQGFQKRMLLYSLILRCDRKGEPPIPIAEMISNDHTTEMISNMLLSLRMDLNRIHGESVNFRFPAELIVTDFSWALIHSSLHMLNNALNIDLYLTATHDSLVNGVPWKRCTGVFLCANHVVHIVTRKSNSLAKSKSRDVAQSFVHCFVLLQYTETMNEAFETVRLIFKMFGNKFLSKAVHQAKEELLKKIKCWKIRSKCESAIENPDSKWSLHKENEDIAYKKSARSSIRKRSPWRNAFYTAFHEQMETSATGSDNCYYSPALVNYLLDHWLPLFPLWCMAVSQLFSFELQDSWYSNAHVENWFAFVKSAHLRQSSIGARVKVNKFIQNQRETILKRLKRFNLSEERDRTKRKRKRGNAEEMHDAEEYWGKRKRAKYTKPTQKTANRLFTQLPSPSESLEASMGDKESRSYSFQGVSSNEEPTANTAGKCDASDTLSYEYTTSPVHSMNEAEFDTSSQCPSVNHDTIPKDASASKKGQPHKPTSTKSSEAAAKPNPDASKFAAPQHTRSTSPKSSRHANFFDTGSGYRLKFVIRSGIAISAADQRSLANDRWLQLNVLHAYLSCLETPQCSMWRDSDWRLIQSGQFPEEAVTRTDWTKARHIFIVVAEPGHFVSIVIDLHEGTVAYLNTTGGNRFATQQHAKTWNKFAKTYLAEVLNNRVYFAPVQMEHPLQRDGSSCGVLVCNFGRCIATHKTLMSVRTDERSIANSRLDIWRTLEENRDTERCAGCRQSDDPTNAGNGIDDWAQCLSCGNWFHFGCILNRNNTGLTIEQLHEIGWECSHCRNVA